MQAIVLHKRNREERIKLDVCQASLEHNSKLQLALLASEHSNLLNLEEKVINLTRNT